MDEYSRAGGIGLSREDFEPLLYMARKKAYTLLNIKHAWKNAGLVPFNRRMLLDRLSPPEPLIQEPVSIDNLPKTTSQLRLLALEGRQLVGAGASPSRVKAVLNTLEAVAQTVGAKAAVYAHEAAAVKTS